MSGVRILTYYRNQSPEKQQPAHFKTSIFRRAAILILAEQLYADKAELTADALEVLKRNALDTEAAIDSLEIPEKEAAFDVEQVLQKEAVANALQVLAEEVYAVKAEKAAADKAV